MLSAMGIFTGTYWNANFIQAPAIILAPPLPLTGIDGTLFKLADARASNYVPPTNLSFEAQILRRGIRAPLLPNFAFLMERDPTHHISLEQGARVFVPGPNPLAEGRTIDTMGARPTPAALTAEFSHLATLFAHDLEGLTNLIAEIAPDILAKAKRLYENGNEGDSRFYLIRALIITRAMISVATYRAFESLISKLPAGLNGLEWDDVWQRGEQALEDLSLHDGVSGSLADLLHLWRRIMKSGPSNDGMQSVRALFEGMDAGAQAVLGLIFEHIFSYPVKDGAQATGASAESASTPLSPDVEKIIDSLRGGIEGLFDLPAKRLLRSRALKILDSVQGQISRGHIRHARHMLRGLQRMASNETADNLVSAIDAFVNELSRWRE